jgi:Tfp pilus assembly protein PilO
LKPLSKNRDDAGENMRSDQYIAALRRHKILIAIIGLILVINIAVFVGVKEQEITTVPRLHQAYEAKRKARLPEKTDTVVARLKQSKEDIHRFVGLLPDKLMIPDVMQEVLELLNRHGLPRVNMSFSPESTDFPGLMRYTTSFSVNGTYPSLKTFLADLQNSKTLFCIEGLALANQTGEDSGPVSLQLKLALYLRS